MSFSESPRPSKRRKTSNAPLDSKLAQTSPSPVAASFPSAAGKRGLVRRNTSSPRDVEHNSESPPLSTPPDLDPAKKEGTRSYGRQRKPPKRYLVLEEDTTLSTLHSLSRRLGQKTAGRGGKSRAKTSLDEDGAHDQSTEAATGANGSSDTGVDAKRNHLESPGNQADLLAGHLVQKPLPARRRNSKAPVATYSETTNSEKGPSVLAPTDGPIEHESSHFAKQWSTIKHIVQEKLAGRRPVPLVGLESETAKVKQLLEQTITAGESNSMLVMGARGAGKTSLVNHVIEELAEEHSGLFYVVRLNGFVQTDDKIALREIWRQLGRGMEIDEEAKAKAYADTLSTLLAVLSHAPDQQERGGQQAAKSIVFIMDEFDLFTGHSRQTLLYNLFDIAQSRKAPIAVVGLTTRMDTMESMEKRVKSRFSHRYVLLNLPGTYTGFEEICRSAITLDSREIESESQTLVSTSRQKTVRRGGNTFELNENVVQAWNECSGRLLSAESVHRGLLRIFHASKSVSAALTSLVMPTHLLQPPKAQTAGADPSVVDMMLPPDSKLHLLQSLPSLALALLIAAARLEVSLDSEAYNFNMVYDEYSNLAARARVTGPSTWTGGGGMRARVWSREAAKAAWEQLVDQEVVLPTSGGRGYGSGDMVRCDMALEEVAASVPEMEKQLEQWCRGL